MKVPPDLFPVRLLVDATMVSDATVTGLAAGATKTVAFHWIAAQGTHVVDAVADPDAAVLETNEDNNWKETTLTVEATPVRGVDLSPATQSKTVPANSTTTFQIVVRNTGSASDTITLTKSANGGGRKATLSATSVTMASGASQTIDLKVTAPEGKNTKSFSVTVTGQSSA
ncbi:MAG TPA: CARDB domain-containing protein, partial [Candidatus Thermoplasmatota archaeon]